MPQYRPPIRMLYRVAPRRPYLIAAGPGTANVGLRTVDYIRQQLAAECFAQLEPEPFFPIPHTLSIEEGVVKLKSVELGNENPQNNFYYYPREKGRDLVFFVGDTQPLQGMGLELARTVMDMAKTLAITKVFIAGAFITDMHYQDEPQVLALVSKRESLETLRKYGIRPAPPITPAPNTVTWLMTAALEKDINVACLVAPIPFYVAEEGNTRACRALVRILSQVLKLEDAIDLAPLDKLIVQEDARMNGMLVELRKSSDEGVQAFLEYLNTQERDRGDQPGFVPQTLPQSLRFIGKLYLEAKQDKSKVTKLAYELRKLSHTDRLQVLKALGPELLEIMGGEIG